MALKRIGADEALAQGALFDTVIDARSESEFARDHLPEAVNWPVLDDAERAAVGTEYKQISAFDARKRGAALAAMNIARHLRAQVMDRPRSWRPLVYCWRGGQRSGALALVLDQIGFTAHVLDGGYRAFRRMVLEQLQTLPATLHYRVLCGRTGSAKSRLLHALAEQGAQVLDLEALAQHRGRVRGLVPGEQQPSQKAFETRLWQALRAFDPARVVYAEGESRTIGRLRLPEPLLQCLRASPCVQVQMPVQARVDFLLHDYAHFVTDIDSFCQRLQALHEVRGAAMVAAWQALAREGQVALVVQQLLLQHYDPIYNKSMGRNFSLLDQAVVVDLSDASPAELKAAALHLLHSAEQPASLAG
jgi:tRNA 2-selenouridine synthase